MPHNFSFCKTRIAPTPSGYLHAGNAWNFLLTAALAQRYDANVLLRIDDLDRERYRPEYAIDIFETLRFLGISWNEGPLNVTTFEQQWSQRHRMQLYHEVLKKLRDSNAVFACVCSRTQSVACTCRDKGLPLNASNLNWRLLTDDEPVTVRTIDGNLVTAALPEEMKNFIVRRKDGLPAYQLASLADDLHFGIDLIVRGEDLWPSTLAQSYLAKKLGEMQFSAIRFYHHPLLKDEQGEKLSKSAGAFSVKHWREQGRSVEDYLAYLGALLQVPQQIETIEALLAVIGV